MMRLSDDDIWVRLFDVTEPTKHRKGYTVYKVVSKVFPKNSIEAVTQVVVWKRYNDFKKLHKALSTIHQNLHLKGSFPKFAEAKFFGRFAEDVIEERRKSALNLLEFAAKHCPLFTSQVFLKFFEGAEHLNPTIPQEQVKGEILTPVKIHSLASSNCFADTNDSKDEDDKKSNQLTGIWEHCQNTDDLSLSSQTSDTDDINTFTDESVAEISLASGDLLLFDPLLEKNSDLLSTSGGENNSWFLSAIQSCTYLHSDDQSSSANIFIPRPFVELDDIECTEKENINRCDNLETFVPESIADLQEFDPLLDCQVTKEGEETLRPSSGPIQSTVSSENTYLFEASDLIRKAQEFEAVGDFVSSFGFYKAAIGILLQGVQEETDSTQRDAVRRKTAQYLVKAEEIYGKHVCDQLQDANRWANDSRLSVASMLEVNIGSLRGSLSELGNYKVLGVIGNVLLVLDVVTNNTFVIKALHKRPDAKNSNLPNIVPQGIPYMVQLYKVYETDYAIFLLLQHAPGGRLWDYVNSYFQQSTTSPCIDCGVSIANSLREELDQNVVTSNVYSGKKLSDHSFEPNKAANSEHLQDNSSVSSNHSSVDSDLEAAPTSPSSYSALFTKYAAAMDCDRVVLAKCNIKFQPEDDSDDNCEDTDLRSVYSEKNSTSLSEVPKSIHLNHDCNEQDEPRCDSGNHIQDNVHLKKQQRLHHSNCSNTFLATHQLGCLSSSTGTLSSQRIRHLSEVFQQLTTTASAHPYLPESCVRVWIAELIIALSHLHSFGLLWQDLHPDNILLGERGHILLTYHSSWNCMDCVINVQAKENMYAAPEVGGIASVTTACDWWSVGALMFELLTGRTLQSCHPGGITAHSSLNIPSHISPEARDLLSKLLKYNVSERLGSGSHCEEDIKSHPFFSGYNWKNLDT